MIKLDLFRLITQLLIKTLTMTLYSLTSGYAMVVHGRPKPLKYKFLGVTQPQGSQSPYILGDTTRPGHVTCVLV